MVDINQDPKIFSSEHSFSNGYLGSKYNHWDINQFKDVNLMSSGQAIFFKSFGNKRTVDTDKLFNSLIDYYKDLDLIFYRLLNNINDLMFKRFAFKTVMFKYNLIFRAITNNWDEIFTDAALYYFQNLHTEYDESFGVSYVAYFDTHFSQVLYNAYINYEIKENDTRSKLFENTYLEKNKCRNLEMYRFSWMTEEEINYFSRDNLSHQYREDSHLLQRFPFSSLQPLSKL